MKTKLIGAPVFHSLLLTVRAYRFLRTRGNARRLLSEDGTAEAWESFKG